MYIKSTLTCYRTLREFGFTPGMGMFWILTYALFFRIAIKFVPDSGYEISRYIGTKFFTVRSPRIQDTQYWVATRMFSGSEVSEYADTELNFSASF